MSSFDIPGVLTPTQKALIRSWWRKVAVANPRADNFQDMKVAVVEKGVFGIPLSESIKYAYSSISYVDETTGERLYGVIPTIIAKCGSYLKEEGLTVEGIFRLSGSAKRIGMLQTVFDCPEQYGVQLDWRGYTVHDAANIMRRFLNHLPDPVITLDYYRPFKDTMNRTFPSLDTKILAFQNLVECLPLAHQYLLLYLLDILSLFSMSAEATRMDTACLASVFVPGILSHPDDAMNPAGYKESQRVLEFLIEHQERFSMPRACTQPPAPQRTPSARHNSKQPLSRNLSASSAGSPPGTRECRSPVPSISAHSGKAFPDLAYFPSSPQRGSLYANSPGSYSVAGLSSLMNNSALPMSRGTESVSSLRRAKTAPSRRHRFGEHESTQVIYVNRTSSAGKRTAKRCHSIQRIDSSLITNENRGL